MPVKENSTRWGSGYDMLARILELKDVIIFFNAQLASTDAMKGKAFVLWIEIEEVVILVWPWRLVTTELQARDLTIGQGLNLLTKAFCMFLKVETGNGLEIKSGE